ncbi:MAG: oligosaccharide flippase family protein [Acidimicrobiales bacterium]|nr:oligosaccharide flippase family protein [Acidimicrobiales bacterium]
MIDLPVGPTTTPRFAKLLWHGAIYSGGIVAGKVAGLLFLPVVARRLGPESFGRLDLLSAFFSAVVATLIFGLDSATTRLYPEASAHERKSMFATWLALAFLALAGFNAGMLALRRPLAGLMLDNSDLGMEVATTGLAISGALLLLIVLTVLRNEARPELYAVLSGGSAVLSACLVAAGMLWRPSVGLALTAQGFAASVFAFVGLVIVRRSLTARPNPALFNRMLRIGLPLAPAAAMVTVGDLAIRTMLLRLGDANEVGFLSLSVRLGSIVLVLVVALQTAWQPRVFALIKRSGGGFIIATDARRIVSLVAMSSFSLAVLAPILVRVIGGRSFGEAAVSGGWMLVAALGQGVFQVVAIGPALNKRLGVIAWGTLLAVVVAVAVTSVLAGRFGASGAAVGLACGQWLAVVAVASNRSTQALPLPIGVIARTSLLASAAIILVTFPGRSVWSVAVGVIAIVMAIVSDGSAADGRALLAGWWTGVVRGSQRDDVS